MTTRLRGHPVFFTVLVLATVVGSVLVATSAAVDAADTPRRGGVLLAAIGADAPGLDPHQEFQKSVLENAYYMPGLWQIRNVVHWAKVKNYVAPPSIFTNQKLQDVWLSED